MATPRWNGVALSQGDVDEIATRVKRALRDRSAKEKGGTGRAGRDFAEMWQAAHEMAVHYRDRLLATVKEPVRVYEAMHDLALREAVPRLASERVEAHLCPACGAAYLSPMRCCGRRTRRGPTPYLTPVRSSPSPRAPLWSVIVPTRNRAELTRKALGSLFGATGADLCEWIVVDCESTDGTHAWLAEVGQERPVTLVLCPGDEPFVFGRNINRGARVAEGRYLLILNNDVEVKGRSLLVQLSAALAVPSVGIAGVDILGRPDSSCSIDEDGYTASVLPLGGHLMALRREVYWEIAGMDEAFDGYGEDEVDLQYRLIRRHYRIARVKARVVHRHFATFGAPVAVSPLAVRNQLLFEAKHGSARGRFDQEFRVFREWRYPEVSVLLVAGANDDATEVERSLHHALASASPTDAPLQYVVVVNGAGPAVVAAGMGAAASFPDNVNCHILPSAVPEREAFQWGLRRCVGRYVAPLRAGDRWGTDRLAHLHASLGSAPSAGGDPSDPFQCLFERHAALADGWSSLSDRAVRVRSAGAESGAPERGTQVIHAERLPRRSVVLGSEQPMVSVVIPCYGRSELLKDALWSCIEQDYDPFEIILVDDGSDPPLEVPYPSRRVRVIRQARNQGSSAARNAGIRAARGKYVKLLDSDDLFLDTHALGRFVEEAERTDGDLVYADCLMVVMTTRRIGRPFQGTLDDRIYRFNLMSPSQVLARRSLFERVQFPEHLRLNEDWLFFAQAEWAERYRTVRIPDALVIYRLTNESISTAWPGAFEGYSKSLDPRRLQMLRVLEYEEARRAEGRAR